LCHKRKVESHCPRDQCECQTLCNKCLVTCGSCGIGGCKDCFFNLPGTSTEIYYCEEHVNKKS
jgi:hypothetical protein